MSPQAVDGLEVTAHVRAILVALVDLARRGGNEYALMAA
jgi:hypothetical protein